MPVSAIDAAGRQHAARGTYSGRDRDDADGRITRYFHTRRYRDDNADRRAHRDGHCDSNRHCNADTHANCRTGDGDADLATPFVCQLRHAAKFRDRAGLAS